MRKGRTAGIPAWKRGLLVGLVGLAAGIRDRQEERDRAMVMGDASGEETVSSSPDSQEESRETKKIALTFDDGPHPRYTEELLDGLAERKVRQPFSFWDKI